MKTLNIFIELDEFRGNDGKIDILDLADAVNELSHLIENGKYYTMIMRNNKTVGQMELQETEKHCDY